MPRLVHAVAQIGPLMGITEPYRALGLTRATFYRRIQPVQQPKERRQEPVTKKNNAQSDNTKSEGAQPK